MSQIKKILEKLLADEEPTQEFSPDIAIDIETTSPKLQPLLNKEDERRGSTRYSIELETVVFCQGNSFRTKTLNISISGALLAESIPSPFINQTLDVVMIRYRGKIRDFYMVKAKSLEAPMRSPRLQFVLIQDVQKKKLQQLFDSLNNNF